MPFTFRDGSVAGTCFECGEPAWSPRSNRCEKHRSKKPYVSKSKKAREARAGAPPKVAADGGPAAPAKAFVDTAGEITPKTFSARAPSASEWEDKLSALVVLATMTYVEYMVVKPFKLPEPTATQAVAYLGMTEEEARTIVEPCSYLIGRSELNKKHGREALEILAFAPAILAVVAWADRVSQFRIQMQAQGGPGVSFESSSAAPGAGATEGGAAVANFGGSGVWDPRQAPTASVNGDRAHLDLEDRPVTT